VKKRYFFVTFFIFLFSFPVLFALGNKDDDSTYLNNEWVLCVTSFDHSELSAGRQLSGMVLNRELVSKLDSVSYRMRISPEYAYYESYAWDQAIGTAAKALANKQNERSQMIYRGDPNWRYKQNVKKIDADIKKLAADLAEKEAKRPLIEREPSFKLTDANLSGTYPAPPQAGGERRFCQSQKADALLTGTLREFHGRYIIQLRLFTLYTNSWIYEDDIIFSLEDSAGAVEEIAARLTAALAGTKPAAITVAAVPPESQILINRNYAGRGSVPPRDHPPGSVTVDVAAQGYTPITKDVELKPGELAEVSVELSPLNFTDVQITTTGMSGASVYHGALYVGKAPLVLPLPLAQLQYVSVERRHERAKVVFTTPGLSSDSLSITLKPKIPPSTGQQRVNRARKWYYWAWGGTWITGIAAWITYGMYTGQLAAYEKRRDPVLYDSTQQLYTISMGTMLAAGVAICYEVFHIGRYMYIATEDVTPIIKGDKRKK